MSEDHQSNNGEEREDIGPNSRPQSILDDIFAEHDARFSPEMSVEAVINLLQSASAATRAHMRERGGSGRRDALREATEGLDRTLREVRTPREESSSNQIETQSSEERANTQDARNRNAQGDGCNQPVGFNGRAPTHAVEAVRRFGRISRRTQASSVTPRRLEAWEHDSGFPPSTNRAEEDRTVERPTSGPSPTSEPMPKVKSPGVPSVILPHQDGDADNSEDSSGESTSSSSSSSSGEHVSWTDDDYKKPREEPASPRAGPSDAHGEALDLGASTLMSAEQSSHAVNSDTGNGDAGEFPGTSSSTVTSQVEGEPQTPGLTSPPGNNGRMNGDTKDATDGKPRVGRRRKAEEMLANVKARLKTKLKKYFRSIKGHCYCEIKRIVEELVHI
ncbi:hypothetical protein BJ166DRAFT_605839 [Pestalotiopsis sp. NC0098]|nr:hypothetical protein BJ166DRAFT_605839 [Pestalotiopsis sp. NC0098]